MDEFGNLADSELAELNEYAASLYDTCGVGIFYVYTTADPLDTYDIDGLTGGMEDYFIMMENESSWGVFKDGLGEEIDTAGEDDLRAVKAEKELIFCNDVYKKDAEGPKSVADIADVMLPHLGANTKEANFQAAKRAAEETVAYFKDGDKSCVVN